MTDSINFSKGAFAVFEPDDTSKMSRFLPFRFNPETLSRQLSIEQAQGDGAAAGGGGSTDEQSEQGADADSGSLKEGFSVMLRFDLADREEAKPAQPDNQKSGMPVEFGILPEISALEDLLYAAESATEEPADGTEAVVARGRRPLVLFIWGEKRLVPIKITGMTINETMFNGKLYPTRAEIEVSLEVLGESDASNNTRVRSSLDFTSANRRKMSRIYLDNTSDQSTNINLPQ